MPSSPEAARAKGPPEPKSRVTVQRTPKLFDGRPEAGAPLQLWSIALSQSVFFGVPEKLVFAKSCRLKTGEVQVVAAEAGVSVSRVPAVARTTAVAAAAVVRLAGFMRSFGPDSTTGEITVVESGPARAPIGCTKFLRETRRRPGRRPSPTSTPRPCRTRRPARSRR